MPSTPASTTQNPPRQPSAAAVVRERVAQGGARYWKHSDFAGLSPSAVATTLSRLAREGQLIRVGKGVYYRPVPTSLGMSVPGANATTAGFADLGPSDRAQCREPARSVNTEPGASGICDGETRQTCGSAKCPRACWSTGGASLAPIGGRRGPRNSPRARKVKRSLAGADSTASRWAAGRTGTVRKARSSSGERAAAGAGNARCARARGKRPR